VKTPEMIDLLKAALTNQKNGYHPDALIFRFLNNNDTGTRFISTHGEALTRIATALLLTVPGVPCIYTADEVGQWFRPYSDTAPLSFKERYPGLRDYHKKLIGLRKEIPSLHSRLWQILEVEPADQVLGYIRFMENHREPVLVLLNFSKEEAAVKLTLPEEFSTWSAAGRLSDLLNGEIISSTGSIPMAPMSARILTPKNG
jgi:glycosidase